MPCTPEELERLSNLIANGKYGETNVTPLIERDPTPVAPTAAGAAVASTRRLAGILSDLRITRHAFGPEFGVQVVDPTLREVTRVENVAIKAYHEGLQIFRPLTGDSLLSKAKVRFVGIPRKIDERVNTLLRYTDINGKYTGGPELAATPTEVQVAQNLRAWYNKYGKTFNVDPDLWINFYAPNIPRQPTGLLRSLSQAEVLTEEQQQFLSRLRTQDNLIFYRELERKGGMIDIEPTATAGMINYIKGGTRAKLLKPFLDGIEAERVNKYFNVGWATLENGVRKLSVNDDTGYRLWLELKDTMLGGVTQLDVKLQNSIQSLANRFGYEIHPRAAYQMSNIFSSLYYAGTMASPIGGRPATLARQMMQLVPTYAELGSKYMLRGVKDSFDKSLMEKYQSAGLLSSPYEALLGQLDVAGKVGRGVSEMTSGGLKLFSATDQWHRVVVARGSELKFDEYLSRGIVNKLPGRKEIRDEVTRLVNSGKVDDARLAYQTENVYNLQYYYGRANRPHIIKGALGNLMNMFLTFPLNTAEMFVMFGKRAAEGDPVPLARLMFTTVGVMAAGSELLNADMYSWTLAQGALPYSLTMPKLGVDTFSVAKNEWEHLIGNVFQTGTTKYQQARRQQDLRDFTRDMKGFVPGGMFFFDDVPKLTNYHSMAWFLGLTPKAAVRDEIAAQRARESRALKQEDVGLSSLKGLQ